MANNNLDFILTVGLDQKRLEKDFITGFKNAKSFVENETVTYQLKADPDQFKAQLKSLLSSTPDLNKDIVLHLDDSAFKKGLTDVERYSKKSASQITTSIKQEFLNISKFKTDKEFKASPLNLDNLIPGNKSVNKVKDKVKGIISELDLFSSIDKKGVRTLDLAKVGNYQDLEKVLTLTKELDAILKQTDKGGYEINFGNRKELEKTVVNIQKGYGDAMVQYKDVYKTQLEQIKSNTEGLFGELSNMLLNVFMGVSDTISDTAKQAGDAIKNSVKSATNSAEGELSDLEKKLSDVRKKIEETEKPVNKAGIIKRLRKTIDDETSDIYGRPGDKLTNNARGRFVDDLKKLVNSSTKKELQSDEINKLFQDAMAIGFNPTDFKTKDDILQKLRQDESLLQQRIDATTRSINEQTETVDKATASMSNLGVATEKTTEKQDKSSSAKRYMDKADEIEQWAHNNTNRQLAPVALIADTNEEIENGITQAQKYIHELNEIKNADDGTLSDARKEEIQGQIEWLQKLIDTEKQQLEIDRQAKTQAEASGATTLPSQIDEITQAENRMGNEAQESTDQAKQGLAEMREEARKTIEVFRGLDFVGSNGISNNGVTFTSDNPNVAALYQMSRDSHMMGGRFFKHGEILKELIDTSNMFSIDAEGRRFDSIQYWGDQTTTEGQKIKKTYDELINKLKEYLPLVKEAFGNDIQFRNLLSLDLDNMSSDDFDKMQSLMEVLSEAQDNSFTPKNITQGFSSIYESYSQLKEYIDSNPLVGIWDTNSFVEEIQRLGYAVLEIKNVIDSHNGITQDLANDYVVIDSSAIKNVEKYTEDLSELTKVRLKYGGVIKYSNMSSDELLKNDFVDSEDRYVSEVFDYAVSKYGTDNYQEIFKTLFSNDVEAKKKLAEEIVKYREQGKVELQKALNNALTLSNETTGISTEATATAQKINHVGQEFEESGNQATTATDKMEEGLSEVKEKAEEATSSVNQYTDALNKNYSIKGKGAATQQLKEAFENANQYIGESSDVGLFTKEGQVAGYAYYKAFENAIKEGVSAKTLKRYTIEPFKDTTHGNSGSWLFDDLSFNGNYEKKNSEELQSRINEMQNNLKALEKAQELLNQYQGINLDETVISIGDSSITIRDEVDRYIKALRDQDAEFVKDQEEYLRDILEQKSIKLKSNQQVPNNSAQQQTEDLKKEQQQAEKTAEAEREVNEVRNAPEDNKNVPNNSDDEVNKFNDLLNTLQNKIPEAINAKNQKFEEEKKLVDEVVDAEVKSLEKLETALDTTIPKAIEKKNEALRDEKELVDNLVGEEATKFEELATTVQDAGNSIKNNPKNSAKEKSEKENDNIDIPERTFLENESLYKYRDIIQDVLNNHPVLLSPELDEAALKGEIKRIAPLLAQQFNEEFGTNISANDFAKAINKVIKEKREETEQDTVTKRTEAYNKLTDAIEKYGAMRKRIASETAIAGDSEDAAEALKDEINELKKSPFLTHEQINSVSNQMVSIDDEAKELEILTESKKRYEALEKSANEYVKIKKRIADGKGLKDDVATAEQLKKTIDDGLASLKKEDIYYRQVAEKKVQNILNKANEGDISKRQSEAAERKATADSEKAQRESDTKQKTKDQQELNEAKQKYIELLKEENELKIKNDFAKQTGVDESDEEIVKREAEIEEIRKNKEEIENLLRVKQQESFIAEQSSAADKKYREAQVINTKKVAQIEESLQKKRITLAQQITQWLKSNPIAEKKYGDVLNESISKLTSQAKMLPKELDEISKGFNQIKLNATSAGETGGGFIRMLKERWKSLGAYLGSFASFYQVVNYVKQMASAVRDLDDSLTEMRKVSDESLSSLKAFQKESFDIADQVGSTAKVIQDSTADWMRLGESLDEAKESAKDASILLNVSEFSSIDEATTALVAMSQAYSDMDKIDIIDKLNNIGNNFSISTDQLATGLQNAAAVLKTQGNDIDKSIALLTAANSIVQDISKASTGIRTIALRIAGTETAKKELEELGESVDDYIVQTTSKTQATIKAYTAVASNAGKGIDVLDANGNLRDTYDILLDISKVYKEIQEEDEKAGTNRAKALVEYIAGKNRSNIAASVLENPELLEKVYKASQDSVGSAMEENEKYLDSISGHIAQLQNQLQKLYSDTLSSDFIKGFVDFLKVITELIDNVGLLQSGLIALTTVIGSKKLG